MSNVQHQATKFEMGNPGKSDGPDIYLNTLKPLPNINLKRNRTQLNIDSYFTTTTTIEKQKHNSGDNFKFQDSPVGSRIPSSNDKDLKRDVNIVEIFSKINIRNQVVL